MEVRDDIEKTYGLYPLAPLKRDESPYVLGPHLLTLTGKLVVAGRLLPSVVYFRREESKGSLPLDSR